MPNMHCQENYRKNETRVTVPSARNGMIPVGPYTETIVCVRSARPARLHGTPLVQKGARHAFGLIRDIIIHTGQDMRAWAIFPRRKGVSANNAGFDTSSG